MIEITQYQIVPKDKSINLKYNGQTTNFERRKSQHTSICVNPNVQAYNHKLYQTIREQGGFDNFEFVILEKHLVNDISEARIRERHWYDLLESNMNSILPIRCYQDNDKIEKQRIEYKKEYSKIYRQTYSKTEKSKQHEKEIRKIKITCNCGSIIRTDNVIRHQKSKKHIDFMNSKI